MMCPKWRTTGDLKRVIEEEVDEGKGKGILALQLCNIPNVSVAPMFVYIRLLCY